MCKRRIHGKFLPLRSLTSHLGSPAHCFRFALSLYLSVCLSPAHLAIVFITCCIHLPGRWRCKCGAGRGRGRGRGRATWWELWKYLQGNYTKTEQAKNNSACYFRVQVKVKQRPRAAAQAAGGGRGSWQFWMLAMKCTQCDCDCDCDCEWNECRLGLH